MADILSVELEKNSPLKCLRPYFSSAGFSSNIIDVRIRLLNPAQTILGSEHSAPIYICTVSRVDSLPKIDFSVFDWILKRMFLSYLDKQILRGGISKKECKDASMYYLQYKQEQK